MSIIERIYELLKEKHKMASDLCKVLGISTSTMSTWKTRNTDPPASSMKQISTFLGVSLEYLLTGKEAPVRKNTTDEEDEILYYLRQLPDSKRYEFIGEIKGYLRATTDKYDGMEKRLSDTNTSA